MVRYFFDTYALFEIVHMNPNYQKFVNSEIITTKFNLMELHYRLLDLYGEKTANIAFEKFLNYIIDFEKKDVINSNYLKLKFRKQKLSYIDCLGYVLADKYEIKFLTGDKEFENFPNVEFVK